MYGFIIALVILIILTLFIYFIILQACDAHKENKSETVNKTNNTSNNTIETINNNAIQNKLIDLSNNEESTIIRRNMKLNKQTKYCLSFGLNYINPIVYRGNDGKLNGCVNDATNISKFLKTEKQFDIVKTFINEEASIQNFLNAWYSVSLNLKKNDVFVLYRSGHGMLLPDNYLDNDTEKSGKDQAAVMYDGCIIDDCINRLIKMLPEITFVYINDSCNSETQYKLLGDLLLPEQEQHLTKLKKGITNVYTPSKDNILDLAQLEILFLSTEIKQRCHLISIASSLDTETSIDTFIDGKPQGLATATLLKILRDNPNIKIKDIQAQLRKLIGEQQTPVVTVESATAKKIANLKLF